MNDFFFGTGGIIAWSLLSAIFAFLATYLWMIVYEVGGIRGTATAILLSGCSITTAGFALLLSHSALISSHVIGAIVTAAWWPMLIAAVVLADLYAADRNGHRSFTTRLYMWFKRVTSSKRENGKHFTA